MSKNFFGAAFIVVFTFGIFAIAGSSAHAQPTPPVAAQSNQSGASTAETPVTPTGTGNQLTPEWLIGNAVSDAGGPQYRDVGEAITRFRNGDVNGARDLLNRARQANSKLPPVEDMFGKLYLAFGQVPQSRIEFEKAVTEYPQDPEAYLYFAQSAIVDHRFTDGELNLLKVKPLIDAYSENLKRKRNFQIQYNSAMAAVNELRTQWEAAVPYLKEWLVLDPDNVAAHQRLGRTYFQLSKPTEAYKEFEDAAKADSHSLNPYIALAELYEQAKDRTNAAKSIDFAVQKNPKDLNVQIMAARWALNTNQLNEAQRYAEKALQIDPKSLDAKVLRAAIARMTGDLKTAETFLEQASTQAPANPEVRNQLALVLVEQDDKEKKDRALDIAQLNLRATSQGDRVNPEIAATYAWVLYKQGKIDEAERILSQVLSAGAVSPDTAYYVGKILQDRGKTENAIHILESALANPNPFAQRQATADLLAQLRKQKQQEGSSDKAGADKGGLPGISMPATPGGSK